MPVASKKWIIRVSCVAAFVVPVAILQVPASAAASTTTQASPNQSVTSRPDTVSASLTAAATGERIEVESLDTPTTTVYANPDGTMTDEISQVPVRVPDDSGSLVPVDLSLGSADGRLAPQASAADVSFSQTGSGTLVDLDTPGQGSFEMGFKAGVDAPSVDDSSASYPVSGSNPATVEVAPTVEGFKADVVVPRAPDSAPTYTFPLTLNGLRANLQGNVLTFTNQAGDVVAESAPLVMYDAQRDGAGNPTNQVPIQAQLINTPDGGQSLVLTPSMTFLSDPSTQYPVTVDPTVDIHPYGDNYVSSANKSTSYGSDYIVRVGSPDGTTVYRTFEKFNLTNYMTASGTRRLSAATLNMYQVGASTCTAKKTDYYPTDVPVSSGMNWNNQPTARTAGSTSKSFNAGISGSCANAEQTVDVTSLIQNYTNGTLPSQWTSVSGKPYVGTIELRADNESDANGQKQFCSANPAAAPSGSACQNSAHMPYLAITYSSVPTQPKAPVLAPGNAGYTTSTTPTLSATVSDPDGTNVRGDFVISQGTTVVWSSLTSRSKVASGAVTSDTVPTGKLVDDQTYTAKVTANDGTGPSTPSAPTTFTVDTSKPATTITSSGFSNGSWSTTQPGSNTFTFHGPADTAAFHITRDGLALSLGASAGLATLNWNPTNGGHTLSVTAEDKAGNTGPASTFTFGVGAAQIASPTAQQASTAVFGIAGSGPGGATSASLQYRVSDGTNSAWSTATNLETSAGSAWAGSVTQSSGMSNVADVKWDARDSTGATGDQAVDVRLCFSYSTGPTNCSSTVIVQLVAGAFGGSSPTTDVGPADISLTTGEVRISNTDAGDASAGVGRTFSSFDGATSVNGPFGYGWGTDLLNSSAASGASVVDNRISQNRLVIQTPTGDQSFKQVGSTNSYAPEGSDDGSRLAVNGAGTALTYTPSHGVNVTWALSSGEWQLQGASSSGESDVAVTNSGSTTFVSQVPDGTSIVCTLSQQDPGCKGLKIEYSGSHISDVDRVVAGSPDERIATYTYTGNTLSSVCDPSQGSNWCTSYTYTTVGGRTLVATMTPPGAQRAWRYDYDGSGRLTAVHRQLDPATGTGDATWTIRYEISPTTSGLPNLSATSAADWGQTKIPTTAAAVWGPNHVPAGTPSAADYAYATIYWSTADGLSTNTAVNPGSHWLVSSVWYNDQQSVTQELDGASWAQVEAAPSAGRLGLAQDLSSYTAYSPSGDRVEDTYGPAHAATLTDGTVGIFRAHTAYTYDDEATGITVPTPPDGQNSWDLVIDTTTSAASVGMDVDYDKQVVRNSYDKVVSTDASGWDLGLPTKVMTQLPAGGWSTTVNRYGSDGHLIETQQPGSGTDAQGAGTDAGSTDYVSYTAGTNSVDSACGNKPAWAGLQCRVGPAAQPAGTSMPTTYITSYSNSDAALVTEEHSGPTIRTTTSTMDSKDRVHTMSTTVTGGNVSDSSLPTDTYTYDDATGQVSSITSGTRSVSETYDSWGRPKTYTDSLGQTSTTTYTPSGDPATLYDGTGTYTYTYGDNRDLPTSVDVGLPSGPDIFTLAYDDNANPSGITYPDGTVATYSYDEVGDPVSLTYHNAGNDFLGFSNNTDVDGRVVSSDSNESSQNFAFNALGALSTVQDKRAGGCTTRSYQFDADSDRTAMTTYAPDPTTGACQATTAGSGWTGAYDAANRLTNSGYSYDNLGRTRTTPAADTRAGALGPLTTTYYSNNMVASLSQSVDDGTGQAITLAEAYTLDPVGRIDGKTSTRGAAETSRIGYHFADSSNQPSSIETSSDQGSTWAKTRYIQVPGLGMVGASTTGGTEWQLSNLHGDVVATQANTAGSSTIDTYSETDEFGAPVDSTVSPRYAYLGTQMPADDALGGLNIMGSRLYNPVTGRFSTPDPVPGSAPSAYLYPIDPVNASDVSGKWWWYKNIYFTSKLMSRKVALKLVHYLRIASNTWTAVDLIVTAYLGVKVFGKLFKEIIARVGWIGNAVASFLALPYKLIGTPGSFCDGFADNIVYAMALNPAPLMFMRIGIKADNWHLFIDHYWLGSSVWFP